MENDLNSTDNEKIQRSSIPCDILEMKTKEIHSETLIHFLNIFASKLERVLNGVQQEIFQISRNKT